MMNELILRGVLPQKQVECEFVCMYLPLWIYHPYMIEILSLIEFYPNLTPNGIITGQISKTTNDNLNGITL